MSVIILQQRLTHYEMIGRGQPIVFLHSWLGSWRTWMPTMEAIADQYRALALDFWNFGDSATRDNTTIDGYVDQVVQFLDSLGVRPPHVVGHGLGGVVAVRAASAYPDRFGKLLITSTPIIGSLLQPLLKPSSFSRLLHRGSNDTWIKFARQISNTRTSFAEVIEDIEATNPATLHAVVQEISTIDLRPDLARLQQPILAIYGGRDRLLTPAHAQALATEHHAFRQVLTFEKSGHFPFLDQAAQFNRALREFVSSTEEPIELKEPWKRRVSQREYF